MRVRPWSPESWKSLEVAQAIEYPDARALEESVASLKALPPLVTSFEILRLRRLLTDAEAGKRFVLQGGDCAEMIAECRPEIILNKLKILLQMSLVLIHGGQRPVVRIGRIAGQYAKPRSSATETRDGVELPSYYGDLVNRQEFTPQARTPDPRHLVTAYQHAALTSNFVRTLMATGFADLHSPELWDLSFFNRADLPREILAQYRSMTGKLGEALRFMEALGEGSIEQLSRAELYTSHEGLNLHYESAQTGRADHTEGYFDLTTHLPWIGERTRAIDGAHVEFFSGIRNPIGVKLGPSTTTADVLALVERLNPDDEPGKLVLISRLGCKRVEEKLPAWIEAILRKQSRVLWMLDPMHGNTRTTASGVKTRSFDDILDEIEKTFAVHDRMGTILGGVHFELTGDDVTECIGGGVSESDLDRNYASACDPRLNYRQAMEMAYRIASRMRENVQASRAPRL